MRCLILGLATALTACSAEPQPDGTDEAAYEELCTGFAPAAETWEVPAPFVYDYFMTGRERVGDYWSLVDLDGDGVQDLVQHHHAANADADEMADSWYVWWSDGTGFGAKTSFSLPLDHREIEGLNAANYTQTVLDIDGDGVLDLILPQDPVTRDIWDADGARHWQVYVGAGRSGFSSAATAWSVPEPFDHQVHSERTGGFGWTTFDLDNDGLVELVHTVSTDNAGTWGYPDNPHWRVHRNTGAGFEAAWEEWPLPEAPDGRDGWFRFHTSLGPLQAVRTQDVTGDGLVDLIAPLSGAWPNPVWGADDTPHWRVYENTGVGFAADWIEWKVPSADYTFPGSAADWVVETSRAWDTLRTGAGGQNLLVAGASGWSVHRNTGKGFQEAGTPWATPDAVFDELYSDGGAVDEGWTTTDLDADGCLDLVLTSGLDLGHPADTDTTWSWQVWRGE